MKHKKIQVVQMTSAHPRYDTRIFHKECKSLAKKYSVLLIVADGRGNGVEEGIEICDVGKATSRLERIWKITRAVYRKALEVDADVYHFHDPELMWAGCKLALRGKRVIFDIHENVARQIDSKPYIPKYIRGILSRGYRVYEKVMLRCFDCLVLAENSYQKYYPVQKVQTVLNMPDPQPLEPFCTFKREINALFYIGRISHERGFDTTVKALKLLENQFPQVHLHNFGLYDKSILEGFDRAFIQKHITFYGYVSLFDALAYAKDVRVGLSVLKPIGNYVESYSTKVFEYMAIGLPVITSNFPLYKDVVEKHACGICIDPTDPQALADAIAYLFTHPDEAEKMGKNGRKAVEQYYNWQHEEKKLFGVYEEVLNA